MTIIYSGFYCINKFTDRPKKDAIVVLDQNDVNSTNYGTLVPPCDCEPVNFVDFPHLKNITGYQRDLLKMRADHATSLLPNPIVVLDQQECP